MNIHYLRSTLSGLFLSTVCLINLANATLIDRGNGMIYDSLQDITWLQNANLANIKFTWDDSVA